MVEQQYPQLGDVDPRPRIIPKGVFEAINNHSPVEMRLDGAKLYSITHLKSAASDPERRYIVYMYNNAWPLFVWDYVSETWYHNTSSKTADAALPHLKGKMVGANKDVMCDISRLGVSGAVMRRIKEARRGL